MKKGVSLFLMITMLLTFSTVLLMANGQQEADEGGVKTVRVWKMGGTPLETEFFEEYTKKFDEENEDINIEYNYFYGQIRVSKIISGFKAGNIADVVVAFGQDIPDFAGLRIIQPLDDIDKELVEGWKDNMVEEIYNVTKYRGKQYALPTYVDMAPFLAYNKDMLAEAGYDRPPRTWSELKEYAKNLTTDEHAGIAIQATKTPVDLNILEGIAYNNGGRYVDEESGDIVFNGPGFADALQLYVDLVDAGVTAGNPIEDNFKNGATYFAEGKAAMWVGMSWLITPWYADSELNWGAIPFPKPDTVTGNYPAAAAVMDPTAALMITTQSENPEAALRFLDYWAQPEQLTLWGREEIARVPAAKKSYELDKLKEFWPEWVESYNEGTLFDGAVTVPRFNGVTSVQPEFGNAVQNAVLGVTGVQEALDDAASVAQENYDLMR